MKIGDLVKANKFANWSARQAKFGFVLEVVHRRDEVKLTAIRVLLNGDVKLLPADHFEVISESR